MKMRKRMAAGVAGIAAAIIVIAAIVVILTLGLSGPVSTPITSKIVILAAKVAVLAASGLLALWLAVILARKVVKTSARIREAILNSWWKPVVGAVLAGVVVYGGWLIYSHLVGTGGSHPRLAKILLVGVSTLFLWGMVGILPKGKIVPARWAILVTGGLLAYMVAREPIPNFVWEGGQVKPNFSADPQTRMKTFGPDRLHFNPETGDLLESPSTLEEAKKLLQSLPDGDGRGHHQDPAESQVTEDHLSAPPRGYSRPSVARSNSVLMAPPVFSRLPAKLVVGGKEVLCNRGMEPVRFDTDDPENRVVMIGSCDDRPVTAVITWIDIGRSRRSRW